MDVAGRFEWSSYQTKLLSLPQGDMHVAFIVYDLKFEDPPINTPVSDRLYNPRHAGEAGNVDWKYNLYYFQIDLASGHVMNFEGEKMKTPKTWITPIRTVSFGTRSGGVLACLQVLCWMKKGMPAFLHVLSGDDSKQEANYFFIFHDGRLAMNLITESTHQWNSGHLRRERWHPGRLPRGGEWVFRIRWSDGQSRGGRIEEWRPITGMTWQRTERSHANCVRVLRLALQ